MSNFRGQQKLDGPQAADRGQRDEFRQGRRRRAEPFELRRRAHAVPRIRPRAARDAVGRDLSRSCRAPMSPAISSSSRRSSTSTGSSSRKCCAASPSTTRPASRCPRRCSTSSRGARRFNQGFATVEYTASALVDLKLHLDPSPDDVDVVAFERPELARIGMPEGDRDAPPHAAFPARLFRRLFGRLLQLPVVGSSRRRRLRGVRGGGRHLRSRGRPSGCTTSSTPPAARRDYDEAYRAFRGRPPSPAALFRKRGLDAGPERG